MEKLVSQNNTIYARIVNMADNLVGNTNFSKDDDCIQVSLDNFEKNYSSGAHFHSLYDKKVISVDEILVIQNGAIRIDFYNEIGAYIKSVKAKKDDIVFIYRGGHNIVATENSNVLTINPKQNDNTRIIGANNFELVIEED